MAASTYVDQVQQLYIAYFGRPADTVGLSYWASQIDAANGNIASVIAGFSASVESAALFGSASSAQKVTAIYQNAFGRTPEAAGLAYWVAQLDSGKVTQAQASWTIQQSAGPGDASAVNNKLIAAKAFTAQIDTIAEVAGYTGTTAAAAARAYLAKVDATYASISNVYVDATAAVATATGTAQVTPPTATTFIPTVTNHVLEFFGTATGDITATWNGLVNTSDAIFTRGGFISSPFTFSGTQATSIKLAATDTLVGSVGTLVGLTVTGTGTVKLTDTAALLDAKSFSAVTTTNDVLTVTGSAGVTNLTGLSGFEAIHLAGSTGIVTIANGAGTVVDSSAAAIVTLGAGGQTFNGSTGNDTVVGGSGNDIISAGAGTNTLSGGAGNDTFNIAAGSINTVSDLASGDVLVVASTGTVTANSVSSFNALATTVNNGAVTINANPAGAVINVSAATGVNGFTINGTAGVDVITGSSKSDILTGGASADTFVFTTAANSSVANFDRITDFTTGSDLIKTGVVGGVASLNQGGTYTTAGTGSLATDIGAAVSAGNVGSVHTAAANDAYVVVITGTGAGTYIFQDTNGNGAVGATELVIQLTGSSTTILAAGDFIV